MKIAVGWMQFMGKASWSGAVPGPRKGAAPPRFPDGGNNRSSELESEINIPGQSGPFLHIQNNSSHPGIGDN